MPSNYSVRRQCRAEAVRLGFPLRLFGRIPIYYFDYFRSTDPLSTVNVPTMTQVEIITIFMLINDIDVGVMLAFFNAGGCTLDTLLYLDSYLHKMYHLYRNASQVDLLATFGDFFVYHLDTRTTRRVDMTLVEQQSQISERFVPNVPNWSRNRQVRQQIREGQYVVHDNYDLSVVHCALRDGLLPIGRYHRSADK